jgi:selenocysteine-specific elongation factor
VIVTLAGHVDHGKTTLVRLLTGTDTDRLAEEKRRGLTIDLGFAYLEHEGRTLGFVDVPGHHRFIHNMVAGVAAGQCALLVIAADDGPMPQSREHLQILQLIGVSQGVVALTKCDRVTPERIAAARLEIADLLQGTFMAGATIIETATVDDAPQKGPASGCETHGRGITELRAVLLDRAAQSAVTGTRRPFRMAVDRAFSLKGAGVVVTGTVHSGRIAIDDELRVFPGGATARVRGLHVQNRPAAQACAGDRAAINLAGADLPDLARGHWLGTRADSGHRTLVVDLQVLDDFPRHLRHWTPVHVYHATSHTTGRLALLQEARLEPGDRAWVELVLDEPLLAKRGDRLVIRDHSLDRTLGGGGVVDNRPRQGRRRSPARLSSIAACAATTPQASLEALLELGPVALDPFVGLWDPLPDELDALLAATPAVPRQGHLVSDAQWRGWKSALLEECRQRHERDRSLQGLRENDFEAQVPTVFRAPVLKELASEGALEQRAGRYQPKRHQVLLSVAEQRLLERLYPLLDQPQPPSLGDIGKILREPLPQLSKAVRALASKGAVVVVNDKRLYLPTHLAVLIDTAERLSSQGPFSAREFRDATGIGRNIAIDVLEYFDARGFTRRQGDTRTVVGDRSRLASSLG